MSFPYSAFFVGHPFFPTNKQNSCIHQTLFDACTNNECQELRAANPITSPTRAEARKIRNELKDDNQTVKEAYYNSHK